MFRHSFHGPLGDEQSNVRIGLKQVMRLMAQKLRLRMSAPSVYKTECEIKLQHALR
jgi:hypothetical protein